MSEATKSELVAAIDAFKAVVLIDGLQYTPHVIQGLDALQELERIALAVAEDRDRLAAALQASPVAPASEGEGWQPIETAPGGRRMFVVCAFDAQPHPGLVPYTSDPYCVWQEGEKFIRWPHKFAPTHWMPLPAGPDAARTASLGAGVVRPERSP